MINKYVTTYPITHFGTLYDTEQVFIYNDNTKDINPIFYLDDLENLSDIDLLKHNIMNHIEM